MSAIVARAVLQLPARRTLLQRPLRARLFHQTAIRHANRDEKHSGNKPPENAIRQGYEFKITDLSKEERQVYQQLPESEQEAWREEARQIHEYMSQPQIDQEMSTLISRQADAVNKAANKASQQGAERRLSRSFTNMGENDPNMGDKDEPFEGDDISTQGHGELDRHRELRHYARLAVWEMPLLSKLAKPFEPPTNKHVLRFRYTTYLGEHHPSAKKVVCQFSTEDIARETGLSEGQRLKLIKLVGVRYNPDKDIVKMSCESFENQMQNKRYLVDLVHKLIAEAKDSTDTFEDIPLDFRHHKPKKVYKFPEEWKLTRDQHEKMLEDRQKREELEMEESKTRGIVDGTNVIAAALQKLPLRNESNVVPDAQHGRPVKGGRLPKLR